MLVSWLRAASLASVLCYGGQAQAAARPELYPKGDGVLFYLLLDSPR